MNELSSKPTIVPAIFDPSFSFNSSALTAPEITIAPVHASTGIAASHMPRLMCPSIALRRPGSKSQRSFVVTLVSKNPRFTRTDTGFNLWCQRQEGSEGFAEQRTIFRAVVAMEPLPGGIGAHTVVRHA